MDRNLVGNLNNVILVWKFFKKNELYLFFMKKKKKIR